MKKFFLFLIPALFISACCGKKSKSCSKKDKTTKTAAAVYNTPEAIAAALPGEWIWFKTNCCGRNAKITTPASEGYTSSILFTPEKVHHFKNDKMESSISYTLGYFEEGSTDKIAYTEQENRKAMIRLSNDTLVIDYGYMDLQTLYYVRKK